jgi:hypothetical protein
MRAFRSQYLGKTSLRHDLDRDAKRNSLVCCAAVLCGTALVLTALSQPAKAGDEILGMYKQWTASSGSMKHPRSVIGAINVFPEEVFDSSMPVYLCFDYMRTSPKKRGKGKVKIIASHLDLDKEYILSSGVDAGEASDCVLLEDEVIPWSTITKYPLLFQGGNNNVLLKMPRLPKNESAIFRMFLSNVDVSAVP